MDGFDTEKISNIIILTDENRENTDYKFPFKKKSGDSFSFVD